MKEELLSFEQRLTVAERTGDRLLLSGLLADDFIGIDSRGARLDKNAFISAFCDFGLIFEKLDIEDLVVKADSASGLVFGRSQFDVTVADRHHTGSAQFMDCWRRYENMWVLVGSCVSKETKPA